MVLDIFQGCILGQLLQELANPFFGRFRVSRLRGPYILLRFGRVWDILTAHFQHPANGPRQLRRVQRVGCTRWLGSTHLPAAC